MVVGLVITVVIYQVVTTYEGIKRTTTSGADTQQNGIFSLSTLERDVRAAGWGMPSADVMRCSIYLTYADSGSGGGPVPNFPGGPLRITDGGTAAGASDSITILWGSSVRANVLDSLLQNVTANPPATAASKLQPATAVALSSVGGFVWLMDDAGNCALTRITASTPVTLPTTPVTNTVILSHDPATGSATQPNYNPTGNYMTANGWQSLYNANPRIYDVGALVQRTYSVANGSLNSQDYFSSATQAQISNNVVSLKAQYGISDAGSQVVNNWVSATNGASGNWANPTLAELKRIKAVRVAVVVRSPLQERIADGATACTTTTTAPASWPGGPTIDLSNDANWRCYRYRTFETVVPLRNVLWANLS